MAGALDGVRILDLSWGIAGPLGVLMLAEHGADVIKVEPPGGDPFRGYSGAHVWNRSRRSVTVDLKTDAGRAAFIALADTADVVVESFRPGVMERLGVGYETLRASNPRLIVCSIPAYPPGHRWADRPGYDALVQASSGQQWAQPGWRMGPIFLHMPMPSMGSIFLVPMGISAALLAREKTGRGQQVTTSLFQGALLYTTQIWQWLEDTDAAFHGLMAKTYPPGVHQQMIFECVDGEWVHTSVMSGLTPTKSMDEILGLDDMPDAYAFMSASAEERQKYTDMRRAAFLTRDRTQLVAELQASNYAVEPIITAEESFDHPQIIANGMRATVQDPVLGETTQMGVPIKLLGTPGAIVGPQPTVGEHNDEIWGGLGYSAADAAAFTGAAASTTTGGK
jgi:crotonobetainyl-CoA:carnitine CoA-transferase CaiB-like acyl-CoA transferase